MPGQGSRAALGVITEVTEGTPPAPAGSTFIPMSSESNKADRPTILSSALTNDRMISTVMPGVQQVEGGWEQPFDGASVGQGIWLWNGDAGYSKGNTPGRLATFTATPSAASGTLPVGTYFYSVATILTQTSNGDYHIMQQSAAITCTLAAIGKADLAWTNPSTFPDGFTLGGFIIYRTAAGGSTGTQKYLKYQLGATASFSDTGAFTPDTAISPYTATPVTHAFIGTVPVTSADPLTPFTVSVYKDIAESEQYVGNRMDGFELSIGDKNGEVMAKFSHKGIKETPVANFTASYSILESFVGWQCVGYINGVKDCTIQGMSLSCKNNVQYLEGLCAVPYVRGTISGRREISVTLDRQLLDHTFLNRMLEGEEAAIQIQSSGQPIVNGYSAYSLSSAVHGIKAVPLRHFLMIDLYRVRLKQAGGPVTGPDQIKESIQADCMKSLTYGTEMKIQLINTVATYA